MSIQFAEAFNQLIREKRIDRALLLETLQTGFSSAVKKKYGPTAEVKLEEDEHGSIDLYLLKNVVAEVEDPGTEISLEESQEYAEGAEEGDTIAIYIPFEEFGRNAIQITKQILMQKIREFERERVYADYADRTGEIVSGSVQQIDRNGILVNLGNAEAAMPRREQIRRERYNQGSSIRACIIKVDKEAKGPMITLSRTSPEFLKVLFTQEVPEIYEGLIEIRSVAREAGGRSKIAVYSRDDRVDAVGACVGMKGSRVQAVVNELSGERIDIVPWSEEITTFVSRALSPARIASVRTNHEEKSVLVTVEDDQLSLAIGKEGQNVRLASRLTGWQIELASARDYEQRERLQESLVMPVEEMVGVSDKLAEKLRGIGVNTVQKLVRTPREELEQIPGMGPKSVDKLLATAEGTAAELENALEELIAKENEQREKEKMEEKPLFDDVALEAGTSAPSGGLTAETLFKSDEETEASAAEVDVVADPAEADVVEDPTEADVVEDPAEAGEDPGAETESVELTDADESADEDTTDEMKKEDQ